MGKRKTPSFAKIEDPRSPRRALEEDLIKVAYLYYELKQSNQEIAKRLKLDKTRVHRLIRLAVKEGMVGLAGNVHTEHRALELDLLRKFNRHGLMDVRVALAPDTDPPAVAKAVHSLAAKYMEAEVKDGDTVGLTCGRAVLGTVLSLGTTAPLRRRQIQLVPFNAYCHWLTANHEGRIEMIDSSPTALVAYARLGMDSDAENAAYFLPVIQTTREQENPESVYLQNKAVCAIKRKAESADFVLCGIGSLDQSTATLNVTRLLKDAGLSPEDVRQLKLAGEINLQPFNRAGQTLKSLLAKDSRHVPEGLLRKVKNYFKLFYAFDLETLREITSAGRKVVAVAYGVNKTEAICAAIRGNYLNTLITDEWTGRALVDMNLEEETSLAKTTLRANATRAPKGVQTALSQVGFQ